MPVRKRKPPDRARFQTAPEILGRSPADKPETSLTSTKPRTGGRNSYGRMTSAATAAGVGQGHKQKYRVSSTSSQTRTACRRRFASIPSYDPNRNSRIARLQYLTAEKPYIHRPQGLPVGECCTERSGSEIVRQRDPAALHPSVPRVHNVELKTRRGRGARPGRRLRRSTSRKRRQVRPR